MGIAGGLAGRSVALLAPLVVMPAMLKYLGETSFGIWMTAVSLTSMAMFVDLGIGNGLLTKLSSAYGARDYDGMRKYIGGAYAATVGIALLLMLLLVAAFVVQANWFGSARLGTDGEAEKIIATCLLAFIVGVPASIIQRVMYACQVAWLSNIWQIVGAFFSVLLCLLAMRTSLDPWEVVGIYSAAPVITMIISSIAFFSSHHELRPRFCDLSRWHAADLLHIGIRFFALSVITSIALNSDNIIVAQKLGAQAVTQYAIPAKLASLLSLVVTTLFTPLWAANGEAIARGDYAWVRRISLKMSLLGGLAVLLAGGLLTIFGNAIVELWMRRAFDAEYALFFSLSLLPLFMAVTSPFNMILNSIGAVRVQLVAWGLFLTFSLPLKWLALTMDGVWRMAAVSAVLYLILISVPILVYTRRKIPGFVACE